ncbi:MAG: YcxB family protein [Thermoanaerobaculia bacterium]
MSLSTQDEPTTELTLHDFEEAELAHASFRKTWRRQLPAVLLGVILSVLLFVSGEVVFGTVAALIAFGYLALYPTRLERAARRKYAFLPPSEHVVSFAHDEAGIRLAVGSEFRAAFPWKELAAVCHFEDIYLFYPPSTGVELCHIVPARAIRDEVGLAASLTANGVRVANL